MGAPKWWEQRRFGLLMHANLATVPAWAPVGQYADWYRAHTESVPDVLLHSSPLVESLAHHLDRWGHIERYDDFFPFLTFEEFDADEWTALARDAGASYALMTAKHHDGLCWWDAPGTDRTVLHDGPARNVLGEFAAACERADLPFGTSYSLLDWADDRYPGCAYVDEVVHPQVLDLVTRYGTRMLWGDGHWGAGGDHWRSDDLVAAAHRIDPDVLVNDRWWAGGATVRTFEYRMPDGILAVPWECRRALGASFGHNRNETPDHLLDGAGIVSLLTEVVAKGGHLLIAVGPDASGRIPVHHAERLRSAGGWIRRHQELIDRGRPWTSWGDDDVRYVVLDDVVHAIDVGGQGRFGALALDQGRARSVTALGGDDVEFDQDERGVRLLRPPRPSQRMPTVYRIDLEERPPDPIPLFATGDAEPIPLADLVAETRPGGILQLGEGTYLGPVRVPDGVTVRGLGPGRTRIDGRESVAITLGAGSRIEHCTVTGGAERIVWLPKPVVNVVGDGACVLGSEIDGHVDVRADGVRVVSCHAVGVVAHDADRLHIARSTFRGMRWDCGVDIERGSGHVIDSCDFADVLTAVRLTGTVGAEIRGNTIAARWWGALLQDTEATSLVANSFEATMRAIDVDGGSQAVATGNAAIGGDSGCVVQGGATECEVAGNHWERCRIGLLVWDAGPVRHRDNSCVDLAGDPVTIGP